MSQVRRAHSVEIIDRRLSQAESAGPAVDPMELVGLHDELARVERKWVGKRDAPRPGGRPLADAAALDARFDRLARLLAVARRAPAGDPAVAPLLAAAADHLARRTPLAGPSPDPD